jgi:excisionase family DNA binding protein
MNKEVAMEHDKNELLTPRQVGEILKVNYRTVYTYIRQGNLKVHDFGAYRIKRRDLEKFINRKIINGDK